MSCDCKLSVCMILFTFFCLCFPKFLFSNCCSWISRMSCGSFLYHEAPWLIVVPPSPRLISSQTIRQMCLPSLTPPHKTLRYICINFWWVIFESAQHQSFSLLDTYAGLRSPYDHEPADIKVGQQYKPVHVMRAAICNREYSTSPFHGKILVALPETVMRSHNNIDLRHFSSVFIF